MKIFVKIKPNSKIEKIKKIDSSHFEVWIKEPPQEGRANKRLIQLMSGYFKVSKQRISIIAGETSKNKILQVE